jgi:hypothetical protein
MNAKQSCSDHFEKRRLLKKNTDILGKSHSPGLNLRTPCRKLREKQN